jgi:4-hydroxy-tetrahydrodipicolinate synthase
MEPVTDLTRSVSGIIPPLITPLASRDLLDLPGLERLVERSLAAGVHGLFILGTCGESAALGSAFRRQMIDQTCRLVRGRVPVFVGVTDTSEADSVALARHAADAGADAVVVSTPYYLPLDQCELAAYVSHVVQEQPLPVLLYNFPALTGTAYEVETVARLSELPRVIGIKDSSGDGSYLRRLLGRVARPDWGVLVGAELLLAQAVMDGASGGVPVGALIDPALFASLYDAAVARDRPRVELLNERLRLIDRIYRLSAGMPSVIRGVKCAVSMMGLCDGRMAPPHRSCDPRERQVIAECLGLLGISCDSARAS